MVNHGERPLARRQFLRGVGATGALLAFPSLAAACGNSAAKSSGGGGTKSSTLKVGVLTPLGGVFETVGKEMRDGFDLYLDTHGHKLGGRKVEVVTADEGKSPADATQAGQRLIFSDKVDFVIGVVTSSDAVALRDLFDSAKVPLVISNANVTALSTTAKSPWVYRTSASFQQQGASAAKWFYDNVAKSDVWVMADDFVGGHDIADSFTKEFTAAGGKVADSIFTPFQKTTDFQPYFTRLRNGDAKGVFAFFGGSEAIAFVKQYRSFGLFDQIPIAGQGSLADSAVLGAEGDAAIGWRGTGNYYVPTLDNPTNQEFRDRYRSAYSEEPSYYACSSYDAGQFIDLALKKTGGSTSDKDALVQALENPGEFDSPRGAMTMDAATHNPTEHFYVYQNVKENGKVTSKVIADVGEFTQQASG